LVGERIFRPEHLLEEMARVTRPEGEMGLAFSPGRTTLPRTKDTAAKLGLQTLVDEEFCAYTVPLIPTLSLDSMKDGRPVYFQLLLYRKPAA